MSASQQRMKAAAGHYSNMFPCPRTLQPPHVTWSSHYTPEFIVRCRCRGSPLLLVMVRRHKIEYLLAQRSRCSLTPARCTAQSASRLSAGALGINTITARRQGELGGLKYEGDSNTQCSVLSEVSSQGNEITNNVMVSIKPL